MHAHCWLKRVGLVNSSCEISEQLTLGPVLSMLTITFILYTSTHLQVYGYLHISPPKLLHSIHALNEPKWMWRCEELEHAQNSWSECLSEVHEVTWIRWMSGINERRECIQGINKCCRDWVAVNEWSVCKKKGKEWSERVKRVSDDSQRRPGGNHWTYLTDALLRHRHGSGTT